ncbi:hypothetical protein [Serratia odorifera]|jgi:hypothetical protein|uniref:Uncharacterized protein n=2 Tax=Serratia odorifera TaxID=618 RepID=D4EAA5_SEROD|nr:hypothetical protein [Serratia odorifera]EFE93258.1 hypothetical protein HMPREF0758_5105 [Serratia odorifera DSM 4582]PNK88267.1 hypothetical protein CEQ31_000300 [Serratia odorifera]RII73929.1 hypothetical protein DX901_01200 [Serratia odorifera]VDZ51267.1 Uncharacterised protein [Serratia odorifera]
MFNNNETLVAAIMANKTAWSALLGALIAQGTVDPLLVQQHLKTCQREFHQRDLAVIAEALDMHVKALEAWIQTSFNA